MRQVFSRLTAKESWSARQVSSAWANTARQAACFEVVLPVHTTDLLSKVKLLSKRQCACPHPNISFTVKLLEPLQLKELASLIQKLRNEDDNLTTFNLAVDLFVKGRQDLQPLTSYAAQVASTSAALIQSHGISVCIGLCASPEAHTAPSPRVLQQLAPLLHSIDLYSVPAEQTVPFDDFWLSRSAFAPAHITALASCSTALRSLCISDAYLRPGHNMLRDLTSSIPVIAQLSSLTKLHLSLAYRNPVPGFQSLSQLSALEDLALQCNGNPGSCHGVLTSCRQSLRTVTLAACCWSSATYTALGQIPCLDRLAIKVEAFTVVQAQAMTLLTARETKLQVLRYDDIDGPALLAWCALSNSMRVHELVLWDASDDNLVLLGSMPFLTALTVVNSSGFTGGTLQSQPNVKELKLIGCPHANAEGLKHLIATALPAVKSLAFQASSEFPVLQMTHQTVEALVCGRNLQAIDLQGVHGLTHRLVTELLSLFVQQAKLGRAQSSGTLQLPFGKLGQHQKRIVTSRNLNFPSLQMCFARDETMIMHPNGRHKVALFPFFAAVLLCLLPHEWKGSIGRCKIRFSTENNDSWANTDSWA